jgi:putative transposase
MKGKRYTTEERIRVLREDERADNSIIEVCKDKGISEQTYHQWKREFGMIPIDQAKRLKELKKKIPDSNECTLMKSLEKSC